MEKQRLDGERLFVIRNFSTADECERAIARSEAAGFDDATINTIRGVELNKSIRDNARLIVDDTALAAGLGTE